MLVSLSSFPFRLLVPIGPFFFFEFAVFSTNSPLIVAPRELVEGEIPRTDTFTKRNTSNPDRRLSLLDCMIEMWHSRSWSAVSSTYIQLYQLLPASEISAMVYQMGVITTTFESTSYDEELEDKMDWD